MNLYISWPSEEELIQRSIKNKQYKKNKKKTKNKKNLKHNLTNLKQIDLKWFVSKVGEQIPPSPIEYEIRTILNTFDIEFHTEVSFEGLNPTGTKFGYLRFDFYIPLKQIAIEYNGKDFHNDPKIKERDNLKFNFCKANNIILLKLKAKDLPTLHEQLFKIIYLTQNK